MTRMLHSSHTMLEMSLDRMSCAGVTGRGVHQITLASQQVAGEPLDDGECSDDCNGDTQHQVNDRDDGEGKIRSQRRKAEERPQQCGSSQNGQIQSAVNAAGGLELIL